MKKCLILLIAILPYNIFSLQAQEKKEKYMYMIIEYDPNAKIVSVSIDGAQFIKEDVDYSKFEKSNYNANPLLSKVNEYQNNGWEVMSINPGMRQVYEYYYACLKKLKSENK